MNIQVHEQILRLTTAFFTSTIAISALALGTAAGAAADIDQADAVATASPIKHVIILIGENRGLDHTFGVYKPKGAGQTISNLLSKGIVNADGSPGHNYALAQQYSVARQTTWYFGAPNAAKSPYNAVNMMPQPNTNGAPNAPRNAEAPFITVAEALGDADINPSNAWELTTGATGLPAGVLDTRVPGAGTLTGPFQLLGPNLGDDDYTGDMTHRFFQAAQQQDCSITNATPANPTGCLNDLFAFVMGTHSASDNSEGNEMGFYNAVQGQAPLLKQLADRFTLSDNFHQAFLGGTAANHVMFATGDAMFWTDGGGVPQTPPASAIADPNPKPGTVNQYRSDGNFVDCADPGQPGVSPIIVYLGQLPYRPAPNCQQDHYYMVNNVSPGYLPNGALTAPLGSAYVIPPSPLRTIGDALNDQNISWAYFGGAYNDAVTLADAAVAANPNNPNLAAAALADPVHALGTAYCDICNPFSYVTSIMGNAAMRMQHIKDTADLIAAIHNNTLPAVSIGKPDSLLDGHPESSKIDLFEGYVENLLDALQKNSHLMGETAVFITFDEAGGYYDSGFVQPIDFFGDGPRIPLLILSPYSTGGMVNHAYADHVSLLKFIERNWKFGPITDRSRDNLPNPTPNPNSAYVPSNMPAIDDLWGAFDFNRKVVQSYTE